jgi:hypothetical protein
MHGLVGQLVTCSYLSHALKDISTLFLQKGNQKAILEELSHRVTGVRPRSVCDQERWVITNPIEEKCQSKAWRSAGLLGKQKGYASGRRKHCDVLILRNLGEQLIKYTTRSAIFVNKLLAKSI